MTIWKTIPGYEGYYEASTLGEIKSVARVVYRKPSIKLPNGGTFPVRERILKPSFSKAGYPLVCLWKEHVKRQSGVHILVAEAFHGPRPTGMYACHRNGIPRDCREDNIYWGTPTQNAADKLIHGTHIQGEIYHGRYLLKTMFAIFESFMELLLSRNWLISLEFISRK